MNNITTLRNHLFDQLNRLKSSKGEDLLEEVEKAKSIISVSSQILETARVEAEVMKQVKELNSGFIPDVVKYLENNQLEEKEKPYEFGQ